MFLAFRATGSVDSPARAALIRITREKAFEANQAIFPLMIRLAEFNGCFLGLEGDDSKFDEWEAWREQATANE